MEIWKDIPGYEGLYQVSDCGQVRSVKRIPLKLKPLPDGKGYYAVDLYKNGRVNRIKIHRLVALAFLEGDNTLTINHIDECKTNNHVSNLEYVTQGDNVRAWIKNNPERSASNIKMAKEACSYKVLDTKTGRIFSSTREVGRYMHEEEGAKSHRSWDTKIQRGIQDRFQILNK